MTISERNAITDLTKVVGGYHEEVVEFRAAQIQLCKQCRDDMAGLKLEMYGKQPRDENAPGMKSDLQSLKESRTNMRKGMSIALAGVVTLGCKAVWGWIMSLGAK